MKNKKIVIVGGVAGGASTAARLRRLDESSEIIIFEKGEYISFANCGLPYYIGNTIKDKSKLTLQTPQSFKSRFNIDVRIFSEVISIDKNNKTIKVKDYQTNKIYDENYDSLVLSMGAEPIKPKLNGIDSEKVFTLRNIPDTYKIKEFIEKNNPKKAVIVGGGYIGIEMAENLHQAGIDVTVVEMQNQIIAPLDYDMACEVHNYIKTKGINLLLGNSLESIELSNDSLNIILKNKTINADMVILSIGVMPETSIAKKADIKLNSKNAIVVDNYMKTSDSNIYAVGDSIETNDYITHEKVVVPLAGPANKQGRNVADNVYNSKDYSKYDGTQGSAILKIFDMTVATTGMNEKTAKRLNIDYDKSFTFSPNHANYYPNSSNMSIKTIFEKNTGKILGVQIVGFDGVDKRCDIFSTAVHFGATANDLTKLELCYAPPFSSAKDPVNMAGYVIENLLSNKVKNFHWHDLDLLKETDNIILLDTRTEIEFNNGHIDGFINIPLDSLRTRLSELDKNKKIYVTCQIGQRGYIACRILSQNGFDCFNLSGGYRLYSTIFFK